MRHAKLFTCMYGSKLYGTSTPTSDVDLKHIVLPDLGDLLCGRPVKNVAHHTNNERNVRNTQDDVDEEFIPIQVFARDFMKGQTYALELAFGLAGDHASQTFPDHHRAPRFLKMMRELKARFLTSNIKAMMGYAVNQANIYSFKGERVNVINEMIRALEAADKVHGLDKLGDTFAINNGLEIEFNGIAKAYPKYFQLTEYDTTGQGAMAPCAVLCQKVMPYSNTVRHTLGIVQRLLGKYGARAHEASADNVDWKAMMHALRIVDEGLELLRDKTITLPFSPGIVKFYLSVKRGEVPLESVKTELAQKLDALKALEASSTLPTSAELEDDFNLWLEDWMYKLYKEDFPLWAAG